jgi:hypothetical protein
MAASRVARVQRLAKKCAMAEHGEWNRKGATLSDVTARKEYGVSRDFIVQGIRAGNLEYRVGSVWGNPYLRFCAVSLSGTSSNNLGRTIWSAKRGATELPKINKDIAALKKKLTALQSRKSKIEEAIGAERTEANAAVNRPSE